MSELKEKKDIVIRDESETLTGEGVSELSKKIERKWKKEWKKEFRKKDPNRILYTLPYVVILLPIALIIIWTILEAVGFIKRG